MDMSKAKGTVRNLNVSHDGNGNVISVNADKTISATTIDPKTLKAEKISTTLSKASEMIGDAEMNQMAGKGAAIDKATDGGKNMNKMFRNAAASELSTFEQLNAAIEAQGGVVPLSKLKGSASYMQTAALSETTDAKLKEGLIQHAKDNGMNISSDQANKMLQKLKEGGDYLTKSIKDAFNSVAKLEGAQQGAKTRSDFAKVDQANSDYPGGFKQFSADQARLQTQGAVGDVQGVKELMSHPEKIKKFFDEGLKKMSADKREEYKEGLIKSGLFDEKGNVHPENYAKASAFFNANNLVGRNSFSYAGVTLSGSFGETPTVKVDEHSSVNKGDSSKVDNSNVVDNSTTRDNATKISTGIQAKTTTLNPAAWAEINGKMMQDHGMQPVWGAIADIKNGNFDNFRRMAEATFGKKAGDEVTEQVKAQWDSENKGSYIEEAFFTALTGTVAYGVDRRYNDGKFTKKLAEMGKRVWGKSTSQTPDPFNPTDDKTVSESDNTQDSKTNQHKSDKFHNNSFKYNSKYNTQNALSQELKKVQDKAFDDLNNGKIDLKTYRDKSADFNKLKSKIRKRTASLRDFKNAGVDIQNVAGLEIGEMGKIYFAT